MKLLRIITAILLFTLTIPVVANAQDDSYPNRPIRLIVPVGAGGATDALARTFATDLGTVLRQTIVVENKAGAASNLGADLAAKAKPDGYTLLFGHVGIFSLNPWLYEKLSFDPMKDFVPVGGVAETPYVLVVAPALPTKNVKDLVEYARARKSDLNYGSVGIGSVQHLAAELFKSETKLTITSVPYNSPTTLKTDLMENRIQIVFDNVVAAAPLINADRIRALAVTSGTRSALLPNVPTMAEAGYPEYRIASWFGLFVPSGTPKPIVEKLAAATVKVMSGSEIKKKLENLGAEPMAVTTNEFGDFIRSDSRKWAQLIKSVGIQPK